MGRLERNRRKRIIRRTAMAVCALVFCVSLSMFIYRSSQNKASRAASDEAAIIAGVEISVPVPVEIEKPVEEFPPGEIEIIDEDVPKAEGPAVLLSADPVAASLAEMDLEALRETNPDVIGWILIPGTLVNYPLMQGDDNQYYLNHTWQKEYNFAGSIFVECQCLPDFSDFNTIIYGHRMSNTNMFGALSSYKKQDFLDSHPSVYIRLDDCVRRYDVYAALEPKITDCIYWVRYDEERYKQKVIDFAIENSVVDAGITPGPQDRLITLSTCTGSGHATRWVVQAVLVAEMKTAEAPESPRLEGGD